MVEGSQLRQKDISDPSLKTAQGEADTEYSPACNKSTPGLC